MFVLVKEAFPLCLYLLFLQGINDFFFSFFIESCPHSTKKHLLTSFLLKIAKFRYAIANAVVCSMFKNSRDFFSMNLHYLRCVNLLKHVPANDVWKEAKRKYAWCSTSHQRHLLPLWHRNKSSSKEQHFILYRTTFIHSFGSGSLIFVYLTKKEHRHIRDHGLLLNLDSKRLKIKDKQMKCTFDTFTYPSCQTFLEVPNFTFTRLTLTQSLDYIYIGHSHNTHKSWECYLGLSSSIDLAKSSLF